MHDWIREAINTFSVPKDSEFLRQFWKGNMTNIEYLSLIEMIDDSFINSMEQFEKDFWDRLLKGRTDKELTSILNDIYRTDVEHFTFSPYYMEERGRTGAEAFKLFSALPRLPLHIDDYGDGFRYAFTILVLAKLFNKRPLLIEEIESHQHSGSLKKLIPILVKIAKTNNLQLFITTHSFDVWRYFMYSFKEPTRKKDFRSFHVVRDANTGKVDVSQEYTIPKIKEDIFEIEY